MEKNPRKYLNQKKIEKIVNRESKYLQVQERKASIDTGYGKIFRYALLGVLTVLLIRLVKWLLSG
jgi:hypothetical protein